MNGIDRLSPTNPLSALNAASAADPRAAASGAIADIGHRVLAWTAAAGGGAGPGPAAWAGATGREGGFVADVGVLARRGDVHGLGGMASDIAARFGATPTQEGTLRRALEDFTRQAMVQVTGLSGASGDRQVAGLTSALGIADAADAGGGVDGVVARVESAAAHLARQNGA